MKKVKFYFVFSLIVVFLSVIGILLGMVLVTIEQKHPEYLSAGIFKGIIINTGLQNVFLYGFYNNVVPEFFQSVRNFFTVDGNG